MYHFKGTMLAAAIFSGAIATLPSTADATSITMNFSGTTTGTITDNTNYFGFGNTIASGQNYSFVLTYDNTIGASGRPPLSQARGEYRVSASDESATFPGFGFLTNVPVFGTPTAPASHITSLDLTLNGVTLTVAGDQFAQHVSATSTIILDDTRGPFGCVPPGQTVAFGCTSVFRQETLGASLKGLSSAGSQIDFLLSSSLFVNGTTGPFLPPLNFTPTIAGSLSLVLNGSSNQTIASIIALNAFGSLGAGTGGGTGGGTDVPIPAALPLFAAGLATLGSLARTRKKRSQGN